MPVTSHFLAVQVWWCLQGRLVLFAPGQVFPGVQWVLAGWTSLERGVCGPRC